MEEEEGYYGEHLPVGVGGVFMFFMTEHDGRRLYIVINVFSYNVTQLQITNNGELFHKSIAFTR